MRGLFRSVLVSLWFVVLTLPIMVIKVSSLDGSVSWRWKNALAVGFGTFILSFIWRILLVQRGSLTVAEADLEWLFKWLEKRAVRIWLKACAAFFLGNLPFGLMIFSHGFPVYLSQLAHGEPLAVFALLSAHGGAFAGMAYLGLRRHGKVIRHALQLGCVCKAALGKRRILFPLLICLLLPLPFFMDIYQVNVFSSAFIWIVLGLGLNVVVGQAGMLVLGYVAFYAVGAYVYAAGNQFFGSDIIGFWLFLPVGGLCAMFAGILLSLPVLRLRGDYLAIVTLGFGEIVRVSLEAGSLSLKPLLLLLPEGVLAALPAIFSQSIDLGGPAGIDNIPYPGFFGFTLSMDESIHFVYYIGLAMTVVTIVTVSRLRDSRLGRSWAALREDEIACEAMGINPFKAKLSAFALGACWAGFGGVLFAAKTNFINPTSFTFMESALILSVVVLGGLDSILGVVLGASILILLPEYLRALDDYRMLIFGASMVLMMVFRPQGLIPSQPQLRHYLPPLIKQGAGGGS